MPAVISADGTRIGYSVTGRGPTLVDVGGALTYRTIDEWGAGMAAALSSRFTVVTYDRRGRGDSGDSGDSLPYAVRREVEDITASPTTPTRCRPTSRTGSMPSSPPTGATRCSSCS